MEEDNNIKVSEDIPIELEFNLTDSPYVGGIKMSSSLKKRLKSVRMHSSPLTRPSTSTVPVAPRSIQFTNFTDSSVSRSQEVCSSREDIESAINEPDPEDKAWDEPEPEDNALDETEYEDNAWAGTDQEVTENVEKMSEENTMNQHDPEIDENTVELIVKASSEKSENTHPDEIDEDTTELIVKEKYINESNSENNENSVSHQNLVVMNESVDETGEDIIDKPSPEISDTSYSKQGIKNNIDEPHAKINENLCRYSKEDIENCNDKDELLQIYLSLQKEAAENEELSRKLKLVQKHHSKNNPDALTDLTKKWLTCTQLALTKLYGMMPIPGSTSFQDFLTILQVDLDIVRYNPETDTFS